MSPKTYFSIEDIETVFLDAYERGHWDGKHSSSDAPSVGSQESWLEYKRSNPTVFEVNPSRPITDSKPQALICPKCGGEMVARKGQYGNFWGCKKYPNCNGTRDSIGRSKEERDAEKSLNDREPIKSDSSGLTFKRRTK